MALLEEIVVRKNELPPLTPERLALKGTSGKHLTFDLSSTDRMANMMAHCDAHIRNSLGPAYFETFGELAGDMLGATTEQVINYAEHGYHQGQRRRLLSVHAYTAGDRHYVHITANGKSFDARELGKRALGEKKGLQKRGFGTRITEGLASSVVYLRHGRSVLLGFYQGQVN